MRHSITNWLIALICMVPIGFVWFTIEAQPNPYNYEIVEIIDGDTVKFKIPSFPKELGHLSLRLYGVDTPESTKADCPDEKLASLNAKLFTEQEISNAKDVKIIIKRWDKWGGRVLGDIIYDGKNLSEEIIKSGYGREYVGGPKESWCTL